MSIKTVHFSIDDVNNVFKECMEFDCGSIFEHPFWKQLYMFHNKYALKATLYLMYEYKGFELSKIPASYKSDFSNNSTWLQFGFHSINNNAVINDIDMEKSLLMMDFVINKLNMKKTNCLRLHNWDVTLEQEEILKRMGIQKLLYRNDDDRYGINDFFINNGMVYRKTDCQIESIDEVDEEAICIGKNNVEVFTHEWCFLNNKEKIDDVFKMYTDYDYRFV